MTFRNILLPDTGESTNECAVRTALHVVKTFKGHLDVLHMQRDLIREISLRDESMSVTLIRELAESIREANAQAEEAVRRRFETILADEKIPLSRESAPSAAWIVETGREAEIVSSKGGAYDLIVFDLASARGGDEMEDALEAALFRTGRPVLLAPPSVPKSIGKTVVLCWNKTAQSARATIAAMPFLKRADRVVVLMVETGAKQGPGPTQLAETLAWHGIEAEVVVIKPDDRPVGRILLDQAAAYAADLLVMGAYSRARWSEIILGGVTNYVIESAKIPVLVAH